MHSVLHKFACMISACRYTDLINVNYADPGHSHLNKTATCLIYNRKETML